VVALVSFPTGSVQGFFFPTSSLTHDVGGGFMANRGEVES
jgi:hypothetical protein